MEQDENHEKGPRWSWARNHMGNVSLTIQNAADLEFPATNPANAPARAEFRLGIFPPDRHVRARRTDTDIDASRDTKAVNQ